MKFGTIAAITLGAVAALGITAGAANAQPVEPDREIATTGVEEGVDYRTTVSRETGAITTAVEHGTFAVVDDGTKIKLTSDTGAVVAEVPLSFEVSGSKLSVAHEISDSGRRLALTPVAGAKEIGEMQPISSMNRLIAELNKNVVGVVAGALLGGLLGALIGLGFFSIITGPIGLVVGAIAGGAIQGGQPFTDALMAVVNGEP
ncbi:hypothetical protein IU486_03205 [Streptomyces gardneri]|uniref:hypothetical protein n=1 Tax=Nocardia TaxID=1817 RepID=UPI00135CE260|nr:MULTISPECIES: hypothetical protein [Nocardia]MBF6163778.1 hypothetical protein [Streptomyces gardneri]MBF6203354.1 hypothetical protein [Streptomyces gardneri]